jgi:hypothetical protein
MSWIRNTNYKYRGQPEKNETRRTNFFYLQLGLHLVAEAQGIELNLKPVVEVLQKHNIN